MDISEALVYSVFILGGLFSLTSACFNFDWFFNHRNSQIFVTWFGRTGARIFYGALGLVLILCGALAFLGYMN